MSTDALALQTIVFHATKNMAYGVEYLVAAAKKAVHAMRRRCISLHLSDPATICKLFDILVLPILSYIGGIWGYLIELDNKNKLQVGVKFFRTEQSLS